MNKRISKTQCNKSETRVSVVLVVCVPCLCVPGRVCTVSLCGPGRVCTVSLCSLPPVTENSTREKVFCYQGENRNVLTYVCENTLESFDWLINYINQLGTCFKIMQPITDNFTMLL